MGATQAAGKHPLQGSAPLVSTLDENISARVWLHTVRNTPLSDRKRQNNGKPYASPGKGAFLWA